MRRGCTLFYIGPSDQLRPAYQRLYTLQVSVQRATLAALAILALLMLGLYWVRPAETGYAWFAAANAAWAAHLWMLLEPRIFLSDIRMWAALPIVFLQWFTIFSAFFINRLPGCGGPRPQMGARGADLRRRVDWLAPAGAVQQLVRTRTCTCPALWSSACRSCGG